MFSENQKISERQMARLLIFDMCGISTLLLPGLLGKMLGTDGVFAILLGAVPVYLFTFLPELLQEKRKNSNTRNGSNTSNISNIGKSYPEILKKQGNGFIRIFVLVVYTVEGILLAGYGLFLLSDLMVSELLKDSSFVLAAVLLMLLCGYGIWQGIEGRARVYEILFWFVFLPLILMLLLATKDVNTIYWTPVMVHSWGNFVKGTAAVVLLYGTMAFVLFLQPYLAENVRVGRTCRKSLCVTVIFNAAIYLITLLWQWHAAENEISGNYINEHDKTARRFLRTAGCLYGSNLVLYNLRIYQYRNVLCLGFAESCMAKGRAPKSGWEK